MSAGSQGRGGAAFGLDVEPGQPGREIFELIDESQRGLQQAGQEFMTAMNAFPRADERSIGTDETETVSVTVRGGLWIEEVVIDDAAMFGEASEQQREMCVAAGATQGDTPVVVGRILQAYAEAARGAMGPEARLARAELGGTMPDLEVDLPAAGFDPSKLREDEYGQAAARLMEWEARNQKMVEMLQAGHAETTVVSGLGEERRVEVRLDGGGILQGIDIDARWLEGVSGRRLSDTLIESLDSAYEQLAEGVGR